MKRQIWKRTAACVLAVLMLVLSGCSLLPKEEDVVAPPLVEPETVTYKTEPVGLGSVVEKMTTNGVFYSTNQFDVAFNERGGYIKELYVIPGQYVEKGEIMAELDTDSLRLQIQQQRYNVERAQIYYLNAVEGKMEGMMSDAERRSVRLAEIDLELAQIQLENLELELSKSVIYAPESGTVVYLTDKEVGQYINARELVARIADPTSLMLRHTGDKVSDLRLNAEVEVSIGKQTFPGVIVVTPQNAPADAVNRNYVDVQVENIPEDVEIGDSASFTMILAEKHDVVVVPRTLLQAYSGDAYYVQVLEDGIKRERPVEVGLIDGTHAEITSGLVEGDLLILR